MQDGISPNRTWPEWHSWVAWASAAPAGGLATRARAALGINPLALRLGCAMRAGLGQAGAGIARSKGFAKRVPGTSQGAWPEAEPKTTRVPLARTVVERR